MKNLTVEADRRNLGQVIAFVDEILEGSGCSMKEQIQVDVAVEELFINISSYSYTESGGEAEISVTLLDDGMGVEITLIDSGVPYNPVLRPEPDLTLPAELRPIGGLGIYMAKQSMDEMSYDYRDGKNVLTIRKHFGKQ